MTRSGSFCFSEGKEVGESRGVRWLSGGSCGIEGLIVVGGESRLNFGYFVREKVCSC